MVHIGEKYVSKVQECYYWIDDDDTVTLGVEI